MRPRLIRRSLYTHNSGNKTTQKRTKTKTKQSFPFLKNFDEFLLLFAYYYYWTNVTDRRFFLILKFDESDDRWGILKFKNIFITTHQLLGWKSPFPRLVGCRCFSYGGQCSSTFEYLSPVQVHLQVCSFWLEFF